MNRSPFIFPSKVSPTNRIQESAAAPFSETLRLFQAAKCPKDVALNKKKRQFSPHMEELLQIPLTEQIKKVQANRSELYHKVEGTLRFDPAVTEEAKRIDSELISALAPLSSAFSSSEFFASKVREGQARRAETEEEDDLRRFQTPVPGRRARLTPMKFIRSGVPGGRTSGSSRSAHDEEGMSSENKDLKNGSKSEQVVLDDEAKREMEKAKLEAEMKQMSEAKAQRQLREKDRKKRLIEKKRLMRQEMEARRKRLAEKKEKKSDDDGDSYNMSSLEDEMSSAAEKQWGQKQAKSAERALNAAGGDGKEKRDSDASLDEDGAKNAKIKDKGMDADDLSFVDHEDAIINDEFRDMERLMGVKFIDFDRKIRPPNASAKDGEKSSQQNGEALLASYGSVYGNGFMPGWAFEDLGLGFGLHDPTRADQSTRAGVGFCDYRRDRDQMREGKRDPGLVVGDVYKLLRHNDGFGKEDQMNYDLMNASLNDPFIDVFCQAGNEKAKKLYWALHANSDEEGEIPGAFKFVAPGEGGVDITSKMLMDPKQHDRLERLGMDENDILMQDRSIDIPVPGSDAGNMAAVKAADGFATPDVVFRDEPFGKGDKSRELDITPDSLLRLYLVGNDHSPCVGVGQGQAVPSSSCGASVQYIAERVSGEPLVMGFSSPLGERYRRETNDWRGVSGKVQGNMPDKEACDLFERNQRQRAMFRLETMGNNDCPLIGKDILQQFQSPLHGDKSESGKPLQGWHNAFAAGSHDFVTNKISFKCPEAVSPFKPSIAGVTGGSGDEEAEKEARNGGFADDLLNAYEDGFKCLGGVGTLHYAGAGITKDTGKGDTSSDAGYNRSGTMDSLEGIFNSGNNMPLNGSAIGSPRERTRQTIRVRVKKRVPKKKDVATLVGPTLANHDNNRLKEELLLRPVEVQQPVRRSDTKSKATHAESWTQTVLSGEMPRRNGSRSPEKHDKETLTPPSMRQRAHSRKEHGELKDLPALLLPESKDRPESARSHKRDKSPDERGSPRHKADREDGVFQLKPNLNDDEKKDAKHKRFTPDSREDKDSKYKRTPESREDKYAKRNRTPDSREDKDSKRKHTPDSREDKDSKYKRTPDSREDRDAKRKRTPDSREDKDAKRKRTPDSREDRDSKHKRTPESRDDKDAKYKHTPESKEDKDSRYRRTPESKDDKEAKRKQAHEANENEDNKSPSGSTRKRAMSKKVGLENTKGLPKIPIPSASKESPASARSKKDGDGDLQKSPDQKENAEKKAKTPEKKETGDDENSPNATRKRSGSRKRVGSAKKLSPRAGSPASKGSPGSARSNKQENQANLQDSKDASKPKDAEANKAKSQEGVQSPSKEGESPSPTRTRKRASSKKVVAGKGLPPIPVPPNSESPGSARLNKSGEKEWDVDNRRVTHLPKEVPSEAAESPKQKESPESNSKDGKETPPNATRKRAGSKKAASGGKQLPPIPVPPTGKGAPGSALVRKSGADKEPNSKDAVQERAANIEDGELANAEKSPEPKSQDGAMRVTPRKKAASRRVGSENLKNLPPIPVPSPSKGAPGSARRGKKGDGEGSEKERKPRRVQFIEESVQPQKAPPLALPKVEHDAHEFEELENFVANPWTHLHSSTQEGVPSEEEHLKLMRELSFVTDTQDGQMDIQADAPIDYTIFYSSLAFPITMKHTAIRNMIETMSKMSLTFQDCITEAVNYIPDFLCPLKNSNIIFEQVATRKKKMFQSKESPVPVRVTFGGKIEIQGTTYDPKEVEIKLTKNGFKIGRDQEYEMDAAYATQLIALAKKPTLDIVLSFLAEGPDFAAKLIAPNMILALVLLNSSSFTFAMVRNLFQLFTRRERHNFLIRSLILAEISQTPVHLLFKRVSIYSKPLLVLFCAFSMSWADGVIGMLDSMKTVEPSKVLKVLIKACLQLPPESFYMIRILLTMLSFTMNDGCQIFSVFFAFLSLVITEVLKLRGQKNSPIPTLMSQILLQLNSDAKSSNRELLYLAPFLVRIFKRVPTLSYSEDDAGQILNFIKEHSEKLLPEILKFTDQQKRGQIIAFSFAQNFRFLINMRREDTTKAITTN